MWLEVHTTASDAVLRQHCREGVHSSRASAIHTMWTFTECVNEALFPLKQSGMHILNYLDDWLILAQSQDMLESQKH